MRYTYNESPVFIPAGSEVTAAFFPGSGTFAPLVQAVLDRIQPWEIGEDPIQTFDLPRQVGSRAVLLAQGEKPLWGINRHHKARHPGLSPFIRIEPSDPRNSTDIATLELSGTVDRPILTRVYPGDYMPPLPWMRSAARADGGLRACIGYWSEHAFVLRRHGAPAALIDTWPDWLSTAQPRSPEG